MFRFANYDDIQSLYELWHSCFGDGKDYVFPFLNNFLGIDNVYVYECDGRIVSAVYALDCNIGQHKGIYFYAVATDEKHRKQGLARKEIEFLIDYKHKQGAEVFLLTPSSEKNRNYYAKMGFSDFFYCEKRLFVRNERYSKIGYGYREENVFDMRKDFFSDLPHVSFPDNHVSFALRASDKVFVKSDKEGFHAYAMTSGKNVTEFCGEKFDEEFLSRVLSSLGTQMAEIYLPIDENTNPDSCKIPRGMIYCPNKDLKENLSENTFLSLNLE